LNTSSQPILPAKIDDKTITNAQILKMVAAQLEKKGLVKRAKVLSKDRTTVTKIILVLDAQYWDEQLNLKADNS
jgi:hypothetical protein